MDAVIQTFIVVGFLIVVLVFSPKYSKNIPNAAVDDDDDEDLMEPADDEEIKDGQWLGVTVRSQGVGGKVKTLTLKVFLSIFLLMFRLLILCIRFWFAHIVIYLGLGSRSTVAVSAMCWATT